MKIILMCSANRGVQAARALIDLLQANDELALFTFKESPWEPPFVAPLQALADENNIQLHVTANAAKAEHEAFIRDFQPDLIFMIGWRYLVPEKIYSLAKTGTFVFHDSLLPAYRGFGPTVWAMVNGEREGGVSLFKISEGMDEGDLVGQKTVPIPFEADIAAMTGAVTDAYLELIRDVIPQFRTGEFQLTPQDHSKATYTCKRTPEDNKIDWGSPAETIYNLIRASTHPYPGAYTHLDGKVLKVWSSEIVHPERRYVGLVPGRVVEIHPDVGAVIAASDGCILIKTACLPDGEKVSADKLIRSISKTLGR